MNKQLDRIKKLNESIKVNEDDIWDTLKNFNQYLRSNELLQYVGEKEYKLEERDFKVQDGEIHVWNFDEYIHLHRLSNKNAKEILEDGSLNIVFERIIKDLEEKDKEAKEVVQRLATIKELLK